MCTRGSRCYLFRLALNVRFCFSTVFAQIIALYPRVMWTPPRSGRAIVNLRVYNIFDRDVYAQREYTIKLRGKRRRRGHKRKGHRHNIIVILRAYTTKSRGWNTEHTKCISSILWLNTSGCYRCLYGQQTTFDDTAPGCSGVRLGVCKCYIATGETIFGDFEFFLFDSLRLSLSSV